MEWIISGVVCAVFAVGTILSLKPNCRQKRRNYWLDLCLPTVLNALVLIGLLVWGT